MHDSLRSSQRHEFQFANWYRALDFKYGDQPLSSIGSIKWIGGRFNFGEDINPLRFIPFNSLYLAEDLYTALREMLGKPQPKGSLPGLTREELALTGPQSPLFVCVRGRLRNVFDLTQAKNLKSFVEQIKHFKLPREAIDLALELGITSTHLVRDESTLLASLMMENWRALPAQFDTPSNCQIFGKLLHDCGYEAVLYKSTKATGKCLAIFPPNFEDSESFVEISTDCPSSVECRSLNHSTWRQLI